MAYANYYKRHKTHTHIVPAIVAMAGLFLAGVLIFYFEFRENPKQLISIFSIYLLLILGAFWFSKRKTTISQQL